jgi:hypothetical protein
MLRSETCPAHRADTESLRIRFHAATGFSGKERNGVSQGFEQQLNAAVGKEPQADTSNNVFVNPWHRRKSRDRLFEMIFSKRQLNSPKEYFATIEILLP